MDNKIIDINRLSRYHDKLYNVVSDKQDKLLSGTNIKTINGISVLGSGDINSNAYQLVNHGTSDTTFTLTPNTLHIWDEVNSLTLTLGDEIADVTNEYIFRFISGSEPTRLVLLDSIKFNSDFTVEKNKIYQISIINGLGTVMSWDSTSEGNDYHSEYFTIEALEDGLIVKLSRNASQYRIDDGSWNTLLGGYYYNTPSINKGQKISFKITNPSIASSYGIGTFTVNKAFNVEGNIMSLLYGDNFEGQTDLSGKKYVFNRLFSACQTLKDASNLILPAKKLASYCYNNMFGGCSRLTTSPQLPAITLADSCYIGMFQGCDSLTTAPELYATTLADNCYNSMFRSCTSLTTAPELPATELASQCYYGMFDNCTSLTTAPALPATTLAYRCYYYMFGGCSRLTTAPELPATTLADDCYTFMFNGCKSLTTAPELPAITLADSCYSYMFLDCTSLTTAPELPADTLSYSCYIGMFNGCKSLTTAPELPAATLARYCYSYMFLDCTSLTTAPQLPAATLSRYCYREMFGNCSKLNYIKMLATDISANKCLSGWVGNVASNGTFIKAASIPTLPSGVDGIPKGWTVENISPCIINQDSESITFVYSDGLFTPNNEPTILSQYFTKEELLSVQPECEITVTLLDKTDNVLTSDYVWANDKTLGDILNELGITNDAYDINVIITKVNAPKDNGYYYYYMLDETEPFVEKDWMRIVSLEDDNTISLSKDIQYSVNGDDWRKLYANNTITVNSDDIIYFKGTNTQNKFTVNKLFNVEGNIMSLLYGDNFEGQIDLSGKDYAFYNLFGACQTLKDASNLILPAKKLASNCYDSMFGGCRSLTSAPELPAIELASQCYYGMFSYCTSLTSAPELPATTLTYYCYQYMFRGCTSLTTAPVLPATTLTDYCYQCMFSNCSKLNYIKMLATDISANGCLNGWVGNVASNGTFIKSASIPTLPSGGNGIPKGWTVENV